MTMEEQGLHFHICSSSSPFGFIEWLSSVIPFLSHVFCYVCCNTETSQSRQTLRYGPNYFYSDLGISLPSYVELLFTVDDVSDSAISTLHVHL